MLHIIVVILKILGICIAALLGILLTLLLVTLFVPVRYSFQGEYHKALKGTVKIHWLFYVVSFRLTYLNETLKYQLRLFGILLFSNDEAWLESRKARLKKKQARRSASKRNQRKQTEQKAIQKKAIQKKAIQKNQTQNNQVQEETKSTNSSKQLDAKGLEKEIDTYHLSKPLTSKTGNQQKETGESEKNKGQNKRQNKRQNKKILISLIHAFKKIVCKIKGFFQAIKGIFKNLGSIKKQIGSYIKFLREDTTKEAIKTCFFYIKKILLYIKPIKLKGNVTFGFEDPAYTGMVLGAAGMFLPFYKKHFNIQPRFEDTIIEGDISGKGRIRLIFFLRIAISVLRNKLLMNKYKEMKHQIGGK